MTKRLPAYIIAQQSQNWITTAQFVGWLIIERPFHVMKEQESIVERINRLAQKDPAIEVVWLYGSRAKGTANESSDYDLAVAFAGLGEADRGTIVSYPCDEIAYQWSKKTDAKISIVDINHAPAALAYTIISGGKVIFCNNDFRLHAEELRIWSLWEAARHEYAKNQQ